jgi:hypothetical protein
MSNQYRLLKVTVIKIIMYINLIIRYTIHHFL